jgi:hypothetical protein
VIEMDRFVYKLSGKGTEEIKRESSNNALTMKENGMTINRLAERFVGNNMTTTWQDGKDDPRTPKKGI